MKKIILIISAVGFLFTNTRAQKTEKVKKYKEIAYKDIANDYDDITVSTNNGMSNKEMTKFKLKIVNKTNDIIVYKPEESSIAINGKAVNPKEKWLIINPIESDFRVINMLGANFVTPYTYVLSGIYKVSTNGKIVETPNYTLPPSQNDFTTGGFKCTMTSLVKESDKTVVKFECTYTGDKIGVIDPGKAAVQLPDGTVLANEKSSSQPTMVMKGKSEKITLKWNRLEGGRATDMQKISMNILWRGTFTETDAVKIKEETLDFQIDEALSK